MKTNYIYSDKTNDIEIAANRFFEKMGITGVKYAYTENCVTTLHLCGGGKYIDIDDFLDKKGSLSDKARTFLEGYIFDQLYIFFVNFSAKIDVREGLRDRLWQFIVNLQRGVWFAEQDAFKAYFNNEMQGRPVYRQAFFFN